VRIVALAAGLALMAALAGCTGLPGGGGTATPEWVQAPDVVGDQGKFLTARGQAAAGAQDALKQADEAARNRLAAVLSEYTQTTARAFLTADGVADSPLAAPFTHTLSAEVSSAILRASISRDTWVDADGATHVLYRVPIALVDDKIVEGALQTAATANPFGKDPQQVAGEVEKFLQSRLTERLKVAARTHAPAPQVPARERTPAWLEADRHAGYPSDKFLSAIGLGADEQAAGGSARTELAAAIDTRMQGQLRALLAEPASGPIDDDVQHLGPDSLHFSATDLVATRIAERWHDSVTDTYYVLAVLDRAAAAPLYRERLSEAQSKAGDLSALAQNDRKADKYAASLVDYLDALSAATGALRMQLAALAVAPEAESAGLSGLTTQPLVSQAKAGLSALLEQISLTAVSGDGQWVPPGGAPRAPLVVQATAGPGKVPLPGVPLRLDILGAQKPVQARTDEAGTASCTIAGPLPIGPRRGTITATLDLAQLAGGADLTGLKPPEVDFHYALRSRANTTIAVYFYDADSGSAAAPVALQLRGALIGAGWQVMDDARVAENVRAGKPDPDAPPADAVDAAGLRQGLAPRQSLLVVVGRLNTHLVDTVKVTGGDLKIVNADYSLALVDAESGEPARTIMTAEGKGQGAYTDDEVEAGARATADAADVISKKVLGELAARFGAQ